MEGAKECNDQQEGAAMTWDEELDAIGLLCPLPVLKARKRLMAMAKGAVLLMRADDPAAIVDVPHFCAEAGHTLVSQDSKGAELRFFIRKSGR